MTWWLEHWTTTPDVLFTFKGNLEIPKIQTSCVKKESSTKQWYSALRPHYKAPGDFWVELVTVQ